MLLPYTLKAVASPPDFLGIFAALTMKLSELNPGQTAIINDFSDDDLSLRFLEMGCVPGEEILLERIAPLGDPIAIRVSGYSLCLRFSEAERILISTTERN